MMKTLHTIFPLLSFLTLIETGNCKELQSTASPDLVAFATGLITPVCLSNAGDSRLFSVDQHGLIMVVNSSGEVNPVPFLDISNRITYGGERGLLGLAFHPRYNTNGYFYVNYVGAGDSTHISRFSVSSTNPDMADPSSEFKLLTLYHPFTNHFGGDLCFGPDGYLYFGIGDGGSSGDPGNRAQNLSEYLGKIHRIDVDGGSPYAIPTTNPYYNNPTAVKEIWALGLRNPWRFSFDRLTHDLWIADVGQDLYEEIDFQPSTSTGGENYGWRCYEGNMPYNTTDCNSYSSYTSPVYTYSHGPECAVIGGFMNRSSTSSPFYGYYFFADYCSDKIWTLHNVSGNWVVQDVGQFSGNNFSTFGEDNMGQLYIAGLTSGTIYRITDATTGLNDNNHFFQAKAIYIPGSGKVQVETDRTSGTEIHLTLFDALGIACFTSVYRESSFVIDVSFLPKGIYFLNIASDGRNQVQKLIIG